jgi:hypothetical protein
LDPPPASFRVKEIGIIHLLFKLPFKLTDLIYIYFAIRNSKIPDLVQQLLPTFLQLGTFHGNPDSVMAIFGTAKDDFVPSKNAFNFSTVHVLLSKFFFYFYFEEVYFNS